MNSKLISSLVFLGLVLSISATQSTLQQLENIKVNEFSNDFVGQQIVDTVLLQQQSGGSADIIVRLLNGLISDLEVQQKKHDAEHTRNNKLWASQLVDYRGQVKRLSHLIAVLSSKILATEKAIRLSHHNIKNTHAQIKLVQQKKAALKAARNVDHQAYVKRHARQGEMNKAVNYIISQLEMALKTGSFVQLENIKQQLQKLTKENPLQALVQLTMTFNPASVAYAIKKLNEIRSGLVASIKNDMEGEELAVQQFHKLNDEFNSFIKHAFKLLHQQEAQLARQQAHLRDLLKQRKEAYKLRTFYRGLIANVLRVRSAYNANYKEAKAKRSSEKSTIRRVIGILQASFPQLNRAEDLKFTLKK